jgi:hypothetical protein
MYQENETLILLQNVGKEDTEKFIPKNTEVTFIKAVDDRNDLTKSIVVVKYGDRVLSLPELAVKPKKKNKTISALKEFNKQMMENRPELKVYHHNVLMRIFYRVVNVLHRLFIAPIIGLHKKLTAPLPSENKDDKVAKELKKLMEGKE